MKSKHKLTAIIGAAAASLLVVIAMPSRKGENAPVAPLGAVLRPLFANLAPGRLATEEQLRLQNERSEVLAWGRDPFSAPTSAQRDVATPIEESLVASMPRLTGISTFDGKRMALIEHEIVSEGDRLASGHTVGEITKTTVTLYRDQERLLLGLGGQP